MESRYGFVLVLVPTVEKFPRRQKFLLGDRLQATALDVLERLVEATYTHDRRRHLAAANLGIEKLRFLCHLARDSDTWTNVATSTRRARWTRPAGWWAAGGRRMRRRRADGLFERIATFEALCAAARRAVTGKRRTPAPAAFLANLESEVLRLERELRAGTWRPGGYVSFEIRDPKRRLISAAPFRDRVVHHAVHAVIAPLFERGFIDHTYANRVDKGTHRAVARYERLRNRYRYVLRGDIYRYFPALDHEVLKADLRRRIACRRTLGVLDRIVDASNPQEPVHLYYPGDDLFTPYERRRGLPIGNLTSRLLPDRPRWLLAVPDPIRQLEDLDRELLVRRDIEQLFGVSRARAVQLMHTFGADLTGYARTLPRTRLLRQLRSYREGTEFRVERVRRAHLMSELRKARLTGIRVTVPVEALDGRLSGLPAGVVVERDRIEVRYAGAKEAVVKLVAQAQALNHDYERFEALVAGEGSSG